MDDFYAAVQEEALSTRVLVTTSLRFRPHRLVHFLDMVRTLRDFPVAKMTVIIHTNTHEPSDLATLERLLDGHRNDTRRFEIVSCPDLPEPYDLCWQHRSVVSDIFLNSCEHFSHFIYLEDDTRFSYINFCYFLYFREFLRPRGLLPAFVRVEYNRSRRMYYSTDLIAVMDFDATLSAIRRAKVEAGPYTFVPVDNAYMGMYVLDQELAQEFVASRSFDQQKSKDVVSWGTSERAAAGLCLENVPAGYLTRYVIAIEPSDLRPAYCTWIYHLPNNFTDWENEANPFGRVPLDSIFATPPSAPGERAIRGWNPPIPRPGSPLASFSSDTLDAVGDFSGLVAAMGSSEQTDLRFRHAPRTLAYMSAHTLRRGLNWFGSGKSAAINVFRDGGFRMHETETLLLHNVVFSPQSTTVCSLRRGFYDACLTNYFLASPILDVLAKNDPLYQLNDGGECVFSEQLAALDYVDATAIPICGTGFHNYGHFLYDGLPVVYMLMAALHAGAAEIIGPPLAVWQHDILSMLGIARRYRAIHRPSVFRKIVVSSHISLHVPYPTRFARPAFDALRFLAGGPIGVRDRKVFISRQFDSKKRVLINRHAVEELFRQAGFEIVAPERLTVMEQIRLFASCAIVAGKSGAAMANVGFCDPGTRVFEIQPEAFVEGWIRAACMLFGHEWQVFFATCVTRPESEHSRAGALEFSVDIAEMRAAIKGLI